MKRPQNYAPFIQNMRLTISKSYRRDKHDFSWSREFLRILRQGPLDLHCIVRPFRRVAILQAMGLAFGYAMDVKIMREC